MSILDKEGAPVAMSPQGQGAESHRNLAFHEKIQKIYERNLEISTR